MIQSNQSSATARARRDRRPAARVAALAGAVAALAGGAAHAAGAERILGPLPVSNGSPYVAQTPVVARDGTVYVATMEVGSGGDAPMAGGLRTVVRKGVETRPGEWEWQQTTVDDRTVADKWHNAASLGLDEAGHVHVAYNMHNLPWQYAVSSAPGDIGAFEFRGQSITQAELDRYRIQNRTSFPSLGSAAIPGNQITYPAFENDRSGRLHVSYRFAAKPARAWERRTLSTGLARYDVGSGTWAPLGGLLDLAPGDHDGSVTPDAEPRAIAGQTGWTSYLPRLTFGPDDSPTVSLLWRNGGPGALVTKPCTLKGDPSGLGFAGLDGRPVASPASPGDCPGVTSADANVGYNTIGDAAADSAGNHHLLLSPVGGTRAIHSWDGAGWTSEPAPGAAVEIFFDAADNLWAIATGPSVHVKRAGESSWQNVVPSSGRECFPHASLDRDGATAYVFTLGCDSPTASVTRLDLAELLGAPIVPVAGTAAATAPVEPVPSAEADPESLGDESIEGADGDGTALAAGPADADAMNADAMDEDMTDGDAMAEGTAAGDAPGDGDLADAPDADGVPGENAPPAGAADALATTRFGTPEAAGIDDPLVLPRLEWRRASVPDSSAGSTPATVFAELPAQEYGQTWTLFALDPATGRYFVPGIDEPLEAGNRYWAIQDREVVTVVGAARGVYARS